VPDRDYQQTSSVRVVCRALHCHHGGNADEVSKAAKGKDASQVTPFMFSQGISKCLHPDLGVSKSYQQNG